MLKSFIAFVIISALLTTPAFSQAKSTMDLIGIWQGNQTRVEFTDNTHVSVLFTGNQKQYGTYTSDFLSDPSTLVMSFPDGNKLLEFKCLIQFIDNNTLKWEVFKKNDFPMGFTNATSILKRIRN